MSDGAHGTADDTAYDTAYARAHRRSLEDPDGFWAQAAEGIDWIRKPTTILDASRPPFYRWFTGATLNTCYNALDRHVIAGRADQPALIHDSPVTGTTATYTYAELLDLVARFAGALRGFGVGQGDRVVIYLPMVPEAVIAMLACARIGAIHSVVFGGFAPAELAARIEDAAPKVVVSASCGIERSRVIPYKPMLDEAIERSSHKPERCIIVQREQLTVELTDRDVGWVVGHSYIVYAPLLTGCTTVLYEGKPVGTPDAGAFWRIVEQYGVAGLFTAPTAIRAVKKEDPEGELLEGHDISSLRTLFLAGERLDPDTYTWAVERLRLPVVDNWWQTETGWPIAANPMGLQQLPIKPGSPTVPVPGYDVRVLDERGEPVPPGTEGAICLRLPMPPGTLPTLWQDDDRYVSSYLAAHDGHYLTGDGGYLDEDGYLFVMGRTDDVLNVAGHRLSTGSIEAALAGHPSVAECAVIGVADQLKGQVPRALVVLKSGIDVAADGALEALRDELVQRVRSEVGAVAALRQVDVVAALPKTRSGKILRKTMRQIADGDAATVPSTIEDPAVLEDLRPVLRRP
jgi:propionyl-CoA synthetase